ncbi:hypothetical protein VHEMI00593 [[Torrubiella] hemipterigena]|uniref:Non-structural maintenance of chromosomes element 1 homolog n=1 Tax=[Torrubiella] hemipterigena TaxID=1531966 RepID=A0A0A1T2S3_9HYPO|nr:hypothetical protein VHEMI00593 [[Torrubiella] hemipterigena]
MEESIAKQYNHRNRAFLQAFMARGAMTFEDAQPLLAAILNVDNDEEQIRPDQITDDIFQEYIHIAGQAASIFDYEIRNSVDQVTKKRIYAFVNTASDPQTQLATTYGADELSFIKRVLEAMFDKYNTPRMEVMAITDMQAIKLARPDRRQSLTQTQVDPETQTQAAADKGLKHSEVESTMASLVKGGWVEKSAEGFYSLSVRALLELRPWLVAMFNDSDAATDEWQRIKFCEACKEILTVGMRCSEPECCLRLHDMCQDAFWRMRRSKNCPKCSTDWAGNRYVGERAVTMTEAYQRGRRQSGTRRTDLAEDVVRQETQGEGSDEEDE